MSMLHTCIYVACGAAQADGVEACRSECMYVYMCMYVCMYV